MSCVFIHVSCSESWLVSSPLSLDVCSSFFWWVIPEGVDVALSSSSGSCRGGVRCGLFSFTDCVTARPLLHLSSHQLFLCPYITLVFFWQRYVISCLPASSLLFLSLSSVSLFLSYSDLICHTIYPASSLSLCFCCIIPSHHCVSLKRSVEMAENSSKSFSQRQSSSTHFCTLRLLKPYVCIIFAPYVYMYILLFTFQTYWSQIHIHIHYWW